VAINGEMIDYESTPISAWHRVLDFKQGTLTHRYRGRTRGGIGFEITARRLVSLAQPDLVACRLSIGLDSPATVVISSELVNRQDTDYLEPAAAEYDPRRAKNFGRRVF